MRKRAVAQSSTIAICVFVVRCRHSTRRSFPIMQRSIQIAALAVLAAAMTACGGGNSAVPNMPAHHAPGVQIATNHSGSMADAGIDLSKVHVMLPSDVVNPYSKTDNLHYGGGAVEDHSHIYVVYWGFGKSGYDPSGEKKYMTAFLHNLGGSPWLNTVHQYYEVVSGKKYHIVNSTGQLKGTWVDNSTVPSAPTDAQVQAEAQSAEQHFGYDADGSYVVATPHDHNSPGFGTQYCAYHGATNSKDGVVSYTNLPYMTDAGQNCGANFVNPGKRGLLDGVSIVEGHELAESQTDPQPFNGWVGPLSEIGDACAWQGLGDIVLGGKKYAVQPLWSNKIGGCTLHTP